MGVSIKKQKEKVLSALKEVRIVTYACKKAGVSTTSFYRWRKDDAIFDKNCEDARMEGTNLICDMAESVLVNKIRKGDVKTSIYVLEHHRDEYKPRTRISSREESTRDEVSIEYLHEKARGVLESLK